MDNVICRFANRRNDGECAAMRDTKCDGYNIACGFYMTEEQFTAEADAAIIENRRRGNCDGCKYRNGKGKCETSQEIKDEKERRKVR